MVVRGDFPGGHVRVRLVEVRCRHVGRGRRVDLLHDSGRQHERLEGGSGLPARLGDEVELVLPARGHGRHCPEGAVRRVDRYDGRCRIAGLVERLAYRDLRGALEPRVDGRVDTQAARADGVRAVVPDQLVPDVAKEVRLADAVVELTRPQPEARALDGPAVLGAGDIAVAEHRLEHDVPSREGRSRIGERVICGRRLRKPGQERSVAEVEISRGLREVRLGRGFDPVRAVAEVDDVQPRAKDSLLRPVAVELNGEARLPHFAGDGAFAGDIEVADELLRQRGTALDDLSRGEVTPQRPRDAFVVHAAVPVETPVFYGDRRAPHPGADVDERDGLAVSLGGNRPERRPVGGVNERVLADADGAEDVEVAVRADEVDGGDSPRGDSPRPDHDQHAERHDHAPRAPLCASPHAPTVDRSRDVVGTRLSGRRRHCTSEFVRKDCSPCATTIRGCSEASAPYSSWPAASSPSDVASAASPSGPQRSSFP